MKKTTTLFLVAVLATVAAVLTGLPLMAAAPLGLASAGMAHFLTQSPVRVLGNAILTEQVTTHCGSVRRLADGAIATRHLLMKKGTDDVDVATCGASNVPLGTVDNTVADNEEVDLLLLGGERTQKMVASEALGVGELLFTAASGKVSNLSATSGTYYQVGVALTAAAADGDVMEVLTCPPVKVTVA